MAADRADSMDVEELLRAVSAGNKLAWKQLGPRLSTELWQYFGRRFDRERSKDLTQDTLTAVVRQLPGFEPRLSFRRWVYGIAHNLAQDAFRARYRRLDVDQEFDIEKELADSTTSASSRVASMEVSAILEEEVGELEPRLRMVIEHDLADEEDRDALAQRENVTRATLRTRRHRGQGQLRERLRERLATPDPQPPPSPATGASGTPSSQTPPR